LCLEIFLVLIPFVTKIICFTLQFRCNADNRAHITKLQYSAVFSEGPSQWPHFWLQDGFAGSCVKYDGNYSYRLFYPEVIRRQCQ
jgi:hypothetical protein